MTESTLVKLARDTIEAYIRKNEVVLPPGDIPVEMKQKAGVFVSLHKGGELRGCIGTFSSTTENVAQEIIRNAIAASTEDPRFRPVEEDELSELEISVDVLSAPVKAANEKELDAKRFGVIVSSGGRRGLLLPDLPGVNTPEEQIAIAKRKAGIGDRDPVELQKFEVKRYF